MILGFKAFYLYCEAEKGKLNFSFNLGPSESTEEERWALKKKKEVMQGFKMSQFTASKGD